MNPKVRSQVNLMKKAIDLANEIDATGKQFDAVDYEYAEHKKQQLAEEYAYTVSRLVGKVVDDAGIEVIQQARKVYSTIQQEVLA